MLSIAYVVEVPELIGGAERCFELLVRGVVARELRAIVFVVGNRDNPEMDAMLLSLSSCAEVRRTTLRRLPISLQRVDVDVVHWHFSHPFAYAAGLPLLSPSRKTHVTTDQLPQLRGGLRWETCRALANRRVSAAIVVGEAAYAEAAQHWPGLAALKVVNNGVPLSPNPHVRDWQSGEVLRLLFVGRLEEQKDPTLAIKVAQAVKDRGVPVELTIIGTGHLEHEIGAAVKAYRLEQDVRILGFLRNVAPEMARAHVMLSTSRFEGLPLTPLEALVDGLPVVASDIGPHREIAAATVGIAIANRREPLAWSDKVMAIAKQLSRHSEAAVASRGAFSIDSSVASTIRVYEGASR